MAVCGSGRTPKSTQAGSVTVYNPLVDFMLHPLMVRISGGSTEGRQMWRIIVNNPDYFKRVWWRVRMK
jgi:hypothetical protein